MLVQDQRIYAITYPESNVLLSAADAVAKSHKSLLELRDLVVHLLRQGSNDVINVAINLAPNQSSAAMIWNILHDAICHDSQYIVKAIPIVIITGSHDLVKLNINLAQSKLVDIFTGIQVIGNLVNAHAMQCMTYAEIYDLLHADNCLDLLNNIFDTTNLVVKNECVSIVYLILHSTQEITVNNVTLSMLSNLINNSLQNDNCTVYSIPFDPVRLSLAAHLGEELRQEIALQIAVSNIVRNIRLSGREPIANVYSCVSGINIDIKDMNKVALNIIWNLSQFDDIHMLLSKIYNILSDMRIEIRNIC